jgi:hypothetical protein
MSGVSEDEGQEEEDQEEHDDQEDKDAAGHMLPLSYDRGPFSKHKVDDDTCSSYVCT